MIVEQRTYTTRPGCVPEYFRLYESFGLPPQLRILQRMVGYYRSETGPLNQVVHLWAYDNMEDRRRRRNALVADPDFADYTRRMFPLLLSQETVILKPSALVPVAWMSSPPAVRTS